MVSNAYSDTVLIAGKRFAVKDGLIQVTTKEAWADPLRITGNQQRGDRVNTSQWVQEDWSSGLGFRTHKGAPATDPNAPQHPSISGFFDSTLETRWAGQVTLSGLIESVAYGTADNANDQYDRIFLAPDGNANIPHLCPSDTGGEIAKISYSSEEIDTASVATTSNYAPIAPVKYKGKVIFFGGVVGSAVPADYRQVTEAGTWSTLTPTTNVSNPIVSSVLFRDIIYVATIDDTDGTVVIEQSSDGGANFAPITGMEVPTGDTRMGQLVSYFDAQGQAALYLQTDNVLYLLDISNELLEPIIEFSGTLGISAQSNAAPATFGLPTNPVVWNGNLYLSRKISIVEFNFSGGWREVSPLVLGRVPDTMLNANANTVFSMRATEGWLYVGFSGGSGDSKAWSSIWAFDGLGYHFIWQLSTTNANYAKDFIITDGVKSNNLGQDVLYVLYHTTGATNLRDVDKIENVTANPKTVTKKYAETGYLVTPFHDGGMTEVDSAIIGLGMGTDDLDTVANNREKIVVTTEINHTGSFLYGLTFGSNSDALQKFGSGAGISGRVWRHKYTLSRRSGTNTLSPVMYYPITYYEKVFPDVHSYTFTIDVKGTVQQNQGQGDMAQTQGVVRAIETIHDTIPLVAFTYPGTEVHSSGATRYVRMVSHPMIHKGSGNAASVSQEIDDAEILVTLEERI